MMKTAIQTVQTYFQSLASGDFDLLGSLLDDQIVWHQPGQGSLSGTHQGKAAVFSLFGKFMEISRGTFKIDEVQAVMGNQDLVVATVHFSAQKPGASISMTGVDVMKVVNEKIVEVYLFSNDQAGEDAFWKSGATL